MRARNAIRRGRAIIHPPRRRRAPPAAARPLPLPPATRSLRENSFFYLFIRFFISENTATQRKTSSCKRKCSVVFVVCKGCASATVGLRRVIWNFMIAVMTPKAIKLVTCSNLGKQNLFVLSIFLASCLTGDRARMTCRKLSSHYCAVVVIFGTLAPVVLSQCFHFVTIPRLQILNSSTKTFFYYVCLCVLVLSSSLFLRRVANCKFENVPDRSSRYVKTCKTTALYS